MTSSTIEPGKDAESFPGSLSEARRLRRRRIRLAVLVVAIAVAQWVYGNRHHWYDLSIYRQAVTWWLHGHDLYDFVKPDLTQGQLGFTYPPFGAVVLVPFALLPWVLSIVLYSVLTVGAVILTTYWLATPVAARHGWSLPDVLVLWLMVLSTLEPIRENYSFGQINILLALLVLLDLLILGPRGSRWAGIGIGLAAAIKLTPAIFIVYLLITRRRRMGLTAIAAAAGASLFAAAVGPRASVTFWTHTLWHGQGLGEAWYGANQSIYGLLARYSAPDRPNGLLWLALVAVAGIAGLWRARRAFLGGDEVVGLTVVGLTGCLVSPISWVHHLYWFVPALIVLIDVVASSSGRRRRWYAVFAWLMLITVALGTVSLFDLNLPEHPFGEGVQGFLLHNWYLLLSIALIGLLPTRRPAPELFGSMERVAVVPLTWSSLRRLSLRGVDRRAIGHR